MGRLSFSVFNKFKALDGVTAPIRKMGKSVKRFGKTAVAAFRRADRASSKFGKRLKGIGKKFSRNLTLPLAILGGLALAAAIDFESAFTGVQKTVNATASEFRLLRKDLIDMSREIPVFTTEIFGIAEAAGQLGIKTKDIIAFTKVMADLGVTTNLTANEAATSLARFSNITDLASDDYERLGSTIVALGNDSASTESEIVEMAMRLATAGKIVGLAASETLGLSAALVSVGIRAESGGTAFSQVMFKINKELGTGSDKMKGFAAVSGKTVKQFEKMWKDDTASALLVFTEGLKKVQDQGGNVSRVLDLLGFEGIRISASLLSAAGSGNLFRKTMILGNKSWKENTALAKEAALRYDTAASKLIIFRNKATIAAAAFGAILVPALIQITEFLSPVIEKFENLSPTMKSIISWIAVFVLVIGPLIVIFGVLAASITAIIAIGAPVIATIAAIVFAIIGVGAAIIQIIKNWDFLKAEFVFGIEFIVSKFQDLAAMWNKLKEDFINGLASIGKFFEKIFSGIGERFEKFASGIGGKIINFFAGDSDEEQKPKQTDTPISPNAGLVNTIREERETRGRVDVNFSNLPKGTEVKQTGDVPGFDLDLGFAGA